jgi:hypothetical protein
MKQILTVILRNQFNLFYRFGYTFIPKAYCIEIEFEDISSPVTQKSLKNLFSKITPFEYDEEYLVLHLDTNSEPDNDRYRFDIQNLVAVYPLSQQAKVSIESKIDQRIKLEDPIFENILQSIENEIENEERKKAIEALWKICKIEGDWETYLDNIGMGNIRKGLEHRKNGISANKVTDGNFWEYLIAYDYHEYFPEGTIRYFYQFGKIFSYFRKKTAGIEGAKIKGILDQIKNESDLDTILKTFNKENLPDSFNKEMVSLSEKFDAILTSVFFLKWKSDLNDTTNDNILSSSIFYKGKIAFFGKYPEPIKHALILLGAFFGFRKFYDAYYDSLNLRFYKTYKPSEEKKDLQEEQSRQETKPAIDAESIFKRLQERCPSVKDDKDIYVSLIQMHGIKNELIDAIENNKKKIKKGKGAPKKVIDFLEKEIKNTQKDIPFQEKK